MNKNKEKTKEGILKFIRTRILFYGFLELFFAILWLPFLIGDEIFSTLVNWSHRKRSHIWIELAAVAIAENAKDLAGKNEEKE